MAEENKGKSKLWSAFTWAAKVSLSVAFGFAVLGALDFTLFHELFEGKYFMASIQDEATALLRGDIPIVNASIADGFVAMGDFFGGPNEVIDVANMDTQASPGNQGFF